MRREGGDVLAGRQMAPRCSVVRPITVDSSVVLPTPLRPMIESVSPRRELQADVFEDHGLAVAARDAVEFERE